MTGALYIIPYLYYLDIELQDSRQSIRIVLEYLQNTAKNFVRLRKILWIRAIAYIHCEH
jgi:hypoxanthine phosphoribosyltransferase